MERERRRARRVGHPVYRRARPWMRLSSIAVIRRRALLLTSVSGRIVAWSVLSDVCCYEERENRGTAS